jgi:hypothetical protein
MGVTAAASITWIKDLEERELYLGCGIPGEAGRLGARHHWTLYAMIWSTVWNHPHNSQKTCQSLIGIISAKFISAKLAWAVG